jgi:hypothetical protein
MVKPCSRSRHTNITTTKLQDDSDPILGIEVAACHPQPEDNMLTACSMRHAKKQRLADCDADQSEITYIDGGANVEYGSDGGWDNDMSSKGTMEAVLAQKMLPPLHLTIPLVSPPPTILFSHHWTKNAY